ncbi:MAG: antitoxin MazE-like protein [Sphingomicrobium sp.]
MNDARPSKHDKFRAYRSRKKASGLREVRIWLPDVRTAVFRNEAKRQAALLDRSTDEIEAAAAMRRLADESWGAAD